MSNEYSNTFTSGSCNYASLNSYNQGTEGTNPPIPATTTAGYYVVPAWSYRPPYDTLVKGGTNGYASVTSGYGKNAEKCNPTFVRRDC